MAQEDGPPLEEEMALDSRLVHWSFMLCASLAVRADCDAPVCSGHSNVTWSSPCAPPVPFFRFGCIEFLPYATHAFLDGHQFRLKHRGVLTFADWVGRSKKKKIEVSKNAKCLAQNMAMAGYIELHSNIQGHIISEGGPLNCISPKYGLPTSEALKLFNDIFDSVNGTVLKRNVYVKTVKKTIFTPILH